MPIYEYECQKCGAHTEAMQKVSDKPLTKCKVCGGKMEKKWSLSGFQFKGEGWYVTDYSKKSEEKKETKADGKTVTTEDKPKTETETKTETKAEEKKETKKTKSKKPPATK
jgi:putative FmdB family regulatory protein